MALIALSDWIDRFGDAWMSRMPPRARARTRASFALQPSRPVIDAASPPSRDAGPKKSSASRRRRP